MAIPDFQTIMLPFLRLLEDGQEHALKDIIESLSDHFSLTPEERNQLLPSGRQATFVNRVGWARTYLKKAGLLAATRRAHFKISDRGRQVLANNPPAITTKFLTKFPEFQAFRDNNQVNNASSDHTVSESDQTPEELVEQAIEQLNESLAADLLQTIKECSPGFFEKLVVDLLLAMGYGGTRKDAGQTIGQSGDGGIDGIIKEDRLGLDVIYLQAKRWENPVGRPEIQKFAGALQGMRAKKGVFITTSDFTKEAREYVSRIDSMSDVNYLDLSRQLEVWYISKLRAPPNLV